MKWKEGKGSLIIADQSKTKSHAHLYFSLLKSRLFIRPVTLHPHDDCFRLTCEFSLELSAFEGVSSPLSLSLGGFTSFLCLFAANPTGGGDLSYVRFKTSSSCREWVFFSQSWPSLGGEYEPGRVEWPVEDWIVLLPLGVPVNALSVQEDIGWS